MRDINIRTIAYVTDEIEAYATNVFWVLLAVLAITMFLYGFFFQATLRNVVARTHIENSIAELTSSLSTLESAHETIVATISTAYAVRLGFKEPHTRIYVSRKQFAQTGGKTSLVR